MAVCTYSKKEEGEKNLTKNFKVREFACKDGSDTVLIHSGLPSLLQKIRDHFGKPVIINSAYRTKTHNAKVGGSPNSQHLLGYAADIRINGTKPKAIYDYVCAIMPNTGGVGLYIKDNFVHVDMRKKKSRWTM